MRREKNVEKIGLISNGEIKIEPVHFIMGRQLSRYVFNPNAIAKRKRQNMLQTPVWIM